MKRMDKFIAIDISLRSYSFVQFDDVGYTNDVVGCTSNSVDFIINDGD